MCKLKKLETEQESMLPKCFEHFVNVFFETPEQPVQQMKTFKTIAFSYLQVLEWEKQCMETHHHKFKATVQGL